MSTSEIITADEKQSAKHDWLDKFYSSESEKITPVLPIPGEENILITSAIPYVNNVPHLGNIIGCVLSADCFARYCRLNGRNTLYICGTDEYGTATETKALAEGLTPKEICDKYYKIHAECYEWFNISFDHFGRTTRPEQELITHDVFWKLEKNGKILRNSVEQLFCTKCERFLADRFVEGICPHEGCDFPDARGDQCDKCGKLVNATELKSPRCKLCSNTPIIKTSKHLFIDLPGVEDKLKTWAHSSNKRWSQNAQSICESWLKAGLKERCITRDLKWGTSVPLEEYNNKVFYVWFDAPLGYVSMTMEYTNDWEKWWRNPSEIDYYQFMAKDNVPFHSVIFPACQLATEEPWTMVTHLMATEYLNYENGKFSKSRNTGVFGDQAKETGIPSDIWRFYLLYIRPEGHDTSFSWTDLQFKNNNELLNNLGNFTNRALKFVDQFFIGQIPQVDPLEVDFNLMVSVKKELIKYMHAMDKCKFKDGLKTILEISALGNLYIQQQEPFKLIKSNSANDSSRASTIIHIAANLVAVLAILLEPYMPDTSATIKKILNNPPNMNHIPKTFKQYLKPGHKINKPYPLIKKITDETIADLKNKFSGVCNDTESNQNISVTETATSEEIEAKIISQGGKVRDLKGGGAAKAEISAAVEELLSLKERLAISKGEDPTTVRSKKGKKK